MKREVIKIDEEKCTGCGICIPSCAEGALQIVNGKAKLISEVYCDGLGACLEECPEGALTIEVREAEEFNEKAVEARLSSQEAAAMPETLACGCPGSTVRTLEKQTQENKTTEVKLQSELSHWPVQLMLVPPAAPFLQNSDLLLVADCVPFAFADFHRGFLKDHTVIVGCPKLDDAQHYVQKISQILLESHLKSLTILTMEVPCCSGLNRIAELAMERAGIKIAFKYIMVSVNGEILQEKTVNPRI